MTWRQKRRLYMDQARRVVVKVGSAVLTGPAGLDPDSIAGLAGQLAWLHGRGLDVVLVSSGAVAAGRGVFRMAAESAPGFLPNKQASAAIGQSRLMHAYDQAFAGHDIATAQVLLTREDLRSRQRFLNARNTLTTLLSWRVIPIINENDTVAVQDLNFGDNDQLGSLILNLLEADLFVNLTSAAGVCRHKPDQTSRPDYFEYIEDIGQLDLEAICGAKTAAGTGGMYSKLISARRAAQLGVPTLILPGREPDVLRRAFEDPAVGTWVQPEVKKIASRKYWLAYNGDPAGDILVDDGAARAVLDLGKSLLPAGIREVRGGFGAGALVRILDLNGDLLAMGLASYGAAELRRIMGHKSSEIEGILGYVYGEAVHRDNLLPYPAVTAR